MRWPLSTLLFVAVMITIIVALLFFASHARAGVSGSALPMPKLWKCAEQGIVVISPTDPIWSHDKDRADFFKGSLRLTVWNGWNGRRLTFEQSKLAPHSPCVRMPELEGEPYSLYGLGAFGSQPLRLSLVF
jgi:hypothetical protein